MGTNEIYGQLYGKYAVDIEGTIRGYVYDVDVEIRASDIIFRLDMYPHSEGHPLRYIDRGSFSQKMSLTVTPKDIVSVGKHCIILGFGKLPDLKDIGSLNILVAENETLTKKFSQCQKEQESVTKRLMEKDDEIVGLKDRLRILKRKEEEFDLVKEELSRQKGELYAAREYIKSLEKLESKISKLLERQGRDE